MITYIKNMISQMTVEDLIKTYKEKEKEAIQEVLKLNPRRDDKAEFTRLKNRVLCYGEFLQKLKSINKGAF